MTYHSPAARCSAIENIDTLKHKIATIPGNHLSYIEATQIIRHLSDLQDYIRQEQWEATGQGRRGR